jgi:hypothetical protein
MARYGSSMPSGKFSGQADYINVFNMLNLNSTIKDKKNSDLELEEKLEKHGFKK